MLFGALAVAVRDALRRGADPEAGGVAAAGVNVVYVAVRRKRVGPALRPFAPAGVVLAASYACLLEAFDRGRVSIVAPLNATQSLWAVVFAALFIGRSEAIGSRLLVAGALIVAGAALI